MYLQLLKIFLTALAVIDDLGAIVIISLFYTTSVSFLYLALALAVFVVLLICNKLKVNNLFFYIIGGVLMWFFMSRSGVHPTITGVLLAFTIPFGDGGEKSPSYILQHFLHKPVAFLVIPLFALANTGITIGSNLIAGLGQNYSIRNYCWPGSWETIGNLALFSYWSKPWYLLFAS